MDNLYVNLQRILKGFLLFFILLTAGGVIYNLGLIKTGTEYDEILFFVFELFFSVQLFFLIRFIFRLADNSKRPAVFTIVCFIISVIIPIILFINFNPRLLSDSYDDLNAARTLINEGIFPDTNPHALEVGWFKNNYFLIIVMKELISFFDLLGLPDIRSFYFLNILFYQAGNVLLFILIRLIRDHKTANKVLALSLLNPFGYLLEFWAYSYSICYPLIIGIIYLMYLIRRSSDLKRKITYSVILAVVCFISYKIKLPVMFPLIAGIIIFLFVTDFKRQYKKWIACVVSFILMFIVLAVPVNSLENKYFHEVQYRNLPVSYWFSIGSHDSGGYSTNEMEMEIINNYENDPEGRDQALRESVLQNYRNNGVSGTIRLWLSKTLTTWSDGYSNIHLRFKDGNHDSYLYEYLFGGRYHLFGMYCNAYRLVTLAGVAILALRKRTDTFETLMMLSLAGSYVFFMIWEVKDIYSAPLVPLIFILASSGLDFKSRLQKQNRVISISYTLSVLVFTLLLVSIGLEPVDYTYDRIRGNGNFRHRIELSYASCIEQTFRSFDEFNFIRFPVDLSDDGESASYEYTISDSNGRELLTGTYDESDVYKSMIMIELDEPLPGGEYLLTVNKIDDTDDYIACLTLDSYYYDLYDGTLTVDGTDMISDLQMEVSYKHNEQYLSDIMMVFIIMFYLTYSFMSYQGYRKNCIS